MGKKSQQAATRTDLLRERVMAFLDHETFGRIRHEGRLGAHVRRAQMMLLAACLSTLGVVAVAGALLTRML
jgi:hypothetical protein